jgi:hypothetical protein
LASFKVAIKSSWFDLGSYSNVESFAKDAAGKAFEHILSQKPMKDRIPAW